MHFHVPVALINKRDNVFRQMLVQFNSLAAVWHVLELFYTRTIFTYPLWIREWLIFYTQVNYTCITAFKRNNPGRELLYFSLLSKLIWFGQTAKHKWTLTKINMSGFFFTGPWQELLPFSTSQSTVHGPEVSFNFFLPKAPSTGLHNSLGKADMLDGKKPKAPHTMGGCLSASHGPGRWSFCFPEPPANPCLECALGSPAQNLAWAASRVESQGFLPSTAENRQPNLEPKPEPESSFAPIVCVASKELYLHHS